MKQILIIALIFFTASTAYSQEYEESDTSFYTPMFDRDTNARVHVGVRVGAHLNAVSFVVNDQSDFADSISNWSNDVQLGFSFGILLDIKLNDHWAMVSGLEVLVSQIKLYADLDGERLARSTNYSTLQIPAWFNYAPKVSVNKMYFGGGATFTVDISKAEDKYNRIVQITPVNLMIGAGVGYRMQLPSKSNLNFDLQLHYGLINMVSNDDNMYNDAMKSINLWEVSFYVSLN